MKIIEYETLDRLKQAAVILKKEVEETRTSFSFIIFENKQSKELHIFKKNIN